MIHDTNPWSDADENTNLFFLEKAKRDLHQEKGTNEGTLQM